MPVETAIIASQFGVALAAVATVHLVRTLRREIEDAKDYRRLKSGRTPHAGRMAERIRLAKSRMLQAREKGYNEHALARLIPERNGKIMFFGADGMATGEVQWRGMRRGRRGGGRRGVNVLSPEVGKRRGDEGRPSGEVSMKGQVGQKGKGTMQGKGLTGESALEGLWSERDDGAGNRHRAGTDGADDLPQRPRTTFEGSERVRGTHSIGAPAQKVNDHGVATSRARKIRPRHRRRKAAKVAIKEILRLVRDMGRYDEQGKKQGYWAFRRGRSGTVNDDHHSAQMPPVFGGIPMRSSYSGHSGHR
ncbi:Hypothetical protein D9617_27g045530 [Elsinoe fawcettii]|nr:Hypothetical protein D9617_27g045530 [Elsinoe fawcettii]